MYIFKLAYRNLFCKGLRSWLNFLILSFAYVVIIWMQGFLVGMQHQAAQAMIQEEIAGGQYWAESYDPYDPYSLDSAFVKVPSKIGIFDVPILMSRAIAYPQGQMRAIVLKGIDSEQKLLTLPTNILNKSTDEIIGFIGTRMAKDNNIKLGDHITIRWKNANGAYDATEIKIGNISKFQSPSIDNNQIWISYENMQNLMKTENCATIIVKDMNSPIQNFAHWNFKDPEFLMKDITQMIKMKSVGSSIFYFILLFLAVISIFDTQVLSLFRRRKEMGTMMALGLTRTKLIVIYTLEGFLNAIVAAFIGAIYGIPLLYYSAKNGIGMPEMTDDFGIAGISTVLYPIFTLKLILGTVILIFILVIIVSYLPSKKIAKLKPTDALRGKWTIKEN